MFSTRKMHFVAFIASKCTDFTTHLLYSRQLSHSALQWTVFWHTCLELVHRKCCQKLYGFSNIPVTAVRNRGHSLWRPRVRSVKNDSNVFPRHLIHTPGHTDGDNLSLASHDQPGVTSGQASEMALKRKPPPSSLLLLLLCWTRSSSCKLLALKRCQKNVLLLTTLTLREATDREPVNSGDFWAQGHRWRKGAHRVEDTGWVNAKSSRARWVSFVDV